MSVRVVGIDGWRKGWVGIELLDGRFERAHVLPLETKLRRAASEPT
ncbi:MAG: hypothetical protein KatS3mg012_2234 [Gaiellaceae bacterium]|nr:MAG: hypothetical protein KatS3mg012_2234 [Gaiellaceae bacterium]